ncbi:MAG TPA: tetratricopeptide repeat protein [Methylovorus sp.]|jgi:tetratricopeptide (TPR) repeat protein|nr:tetratricopeptide repeat protein [Methylovorus sp.]
MKRTLIGLCLLGTALLAAPVYADEKVDAAIVKLQHDWARANYQIPDGQQEPVLKALSEEAHQVTSANPGAPEAMIWEAIILSTYAKAKGGLGALKLAEKSRDLLLAAEKINPNALNGSIYTSLGSLYYKVPGWPIGFGDKKKAREYLEKALQQNPAGIDPNYFYADFLSEQGEYAKAVEYYKKALAAPARPGREDADAGRRQDVEEGLKVAEKKR